MRRWALIAAAAATVAGVAVAVVALVHDSSDGAAALSMPTLPEGVTTLDPPVLPAPEPLRPTSTPIPILMYHVIADPPADARYPELYVSRHRLRPSDRLAREPWLPCRDASGGVPALELRRRTSRPTPS